MVFAIAAFAGCQGDRPMLAEVQGTITLDGEPFPEAVVVFEREGIRPSSGVTDAQGQYRLGYLRDVSGAALGSHTVRIRRLPEEDGVPAEEMPARYDRESILTAEVVSGTNTFDFALESD